MKESTVRTETFFDEKENILYTKVSGIVHLEDMFKSAEYLATDRSLPRILRIVEDAREAKVSFSENELHLLARKIEIAADNFISIRHAVIHSCPMNTAFSILISEMIKRENYYLKVFSTMEGAKDWVKINAI